jgi:hypothetical protein
MAEPGNPFVCTDVYKGDERSRREENGLGNRYRGE